MPSQSRIELTTRLRDVRRLTVIHRELAGSNAAGRKATHGPSVTRAGVVLLAAAQEGFVEDLFEETADILFASLSEADRQALYKQTSRRLNTANVHNTDMLFFHLGIPWIMNEIRWQKFSNASFRTSLNALIETRGKIAHGRTPHVTMSRLKAWNTFVEKYAEVLECVLAQHLENRTGFRPAW